MEGVEKRVALDVWPVQNTENDLFPEQELGYVVLTEKSVGIAASGGGSRSHALCAGYFRGLDEINVLDKVTYLSSVSGGSWASSILTYAKVKNARLLGEWLEPEQCYMEALESKSPGELAEAVIEFLSSFFALLAGQVGEKSRNWWPRYVGTSLLKQVRLQRKMFAVNEEHKAYILEQNKDCPFITECADDIVCPPKGMNRPFLIINGTLKGPTGLASGWGASLQFTALYSGVPYFAHNKYSFNYRVFGGNYRFIALSTALWHKKFAPDYMPLLLKFMNRDLEAEMDPPDDDLEVVGWLTWTLRAATMIARKLSMGITSAITGIDYKKPINLITGGGFISTHAFGLKRYLDEKSMFGGKAEAIVKKDNPFYLEDAVGISSAAFGAFGQNFGLDSTIPKLPYLPVLSKTDKKFGLDKFQEHNKNEYLERAFGDGGNFENTGILALVQRRVKKIIAFINTSEPLLSANVPFKDGKYLYDGSWCACTQLLCLFGRGAYLNFGANYMLNQIFSQGDLDLVLRMMLRNRDIEGVGAVAKVNLTTIENRYWGIPKDLDVEIMFIYNEECTNFTKKLPDETKRAFGLQVSDILGQTKDQVDHYNFPHFPTTKISPRIFSLDRKQVNLATAHAAYIIKANEAYVKEIFA